MPDRRDDAAIQWLPPPGRVPLSVPPAVGNAGRVLFVAALTSFEVGNQLRVWLVRRRGFLIETCGSLDFLLLFFGHSYLL